MPPPINPRARAKVRTLRGRKGAFTYIGGQLRRYDEHGRAVPVETPVPQPPITERKLSLWRRIMGER